MARADRLERLDNRRADLETEYTAALVAALRATAAGKKGLLGHNKDPHDHAKIGPVLENLEEMAEAIDAMREQLSMEPFALHAEFLAARGPVKSHAVGEPRQAQEWLDRMDLPPE